MIRETQEPLRRMADGTVKQINPFTGTQVWTVPGRANRPFSVGVVDPRPVAPGDEKRLCAFCEDRHLQTPPEKARLVRAGGLWENLTEITAAELDSTVAEFRLIPNLFAILPLSYWVANHGFQIPSTAMGRARRYWSDPAGRDHLNAVVRGKLLASGLDEEQWDSMPGDQRFGHALPFFVGSHDVVVARRHLVDGATDDGALASSGTLTAEEHHQYLRFTIRAIQAQYEFNPNAAYVAAFQNWLKPAGASFDHLHKQIAAVDEFGQRMTQEMDLLARRPNAYNQWGVDYAASRGLLIAANDHAVAYAGFGHRYPSLEIFSRSRHTRPWNVSAEEVRGFSDLLHACHASMGPSIPCNEEWHYQPPSARQRIPWHVVLKWRVSTLAGFEGSTKINLNTIDPWLLRSRTVDRLQALKQARTLTSMMIGDDCALPSHSLRYLYGADS